VLVFHSALGRTEAVLDYADTLAERGYAACVLDFYRGELPRSLDEARALRDEANENADAHQRLVADAYAMLAVDPRVQATHRFLLGWSYGGAWATFSAGTLEDVSGVVAIYGEAFADATLYERVSTPVALVGAARDTEPSIERLRDVEAELHRRGTEVSLVIVDAAHGFMEPAHPGYSQQAAEQAWESVLVFLDGTSDRR
jgi:dienelactone hydrolase